MTEAELREIFNKHGAVDRVDLPWDDSAGRPRGFGFVDMPSDGEGARAVQALNGHPLGGRTLVVDSARPPARSGGGHGMPADPGAHNDHGADRHRNQNRPGRGGWEGRNRGRR